MSRPQYHLVKTAQYNEQSYWTDGVSSANETGFPRDVTRSVSETYLGSFHYAAVESKGSDTSTWRTYSYERFAIAGAAPVETIWSNWYSYDQDGFQFVHRYVSSVRVGTTKYALNWALPSKIESQKEEVFSIATSKLLSRLLDARSQWNAAVALGEGRETASYITRLASRVYHSTLAFKKGRVWDAYRHLTGRSQPPHRSEIRRIRSLQLRADRDKLNWKDDASSLYMELSFAVRPLLSDIDTAAKYLAEKHVGRTLAPVRVSVRHMLTETQKEGNEWLVCQNSVRLTYELYPEFTREPSTLSELGFTDLPTTAWELLPLSFVIDYVWNIGQVLQSLYEFRQWSVLRGLQASRMDVYRVTPASVVSGPMYHLDTPVQNYHWWKCSRVTLGSLPTSVPLRTQISNPFDMSNSKLATVCILLRYAFK